MHARTEYPTPLTGLTLWLLVLSAQKDAVLTCQISANIGLKGRNFVLCRHLCTSPPAAPQGPRNHLHHCQSREGSHHFDPPDFPNTIPTRICCVSIEHCLAGAIVSSFNIVAYWVIPSLQSCAELRGRLPQVAAYQHKNAREYSTCVSKDHRSSSFGNYCN